MAVPSAKTPVSWLLLGELDQELMCWKEHLQTKASSATSTLCYSSQCGCKSHCAGSKTGSSTSAQGSQAAQEDSFSHRTMAHSPAMPSFTSKNQRCWDKWWAVSKCSPMHVLSQSEMLIILSGQCAKGITLSKQGHCSGPTHCSTSPASEPSLLYSPSPEPQHCSAKHSPWAECSCGRCRRVALAQHRIVEQDKGCCAAPMEGHSHTQWHWAWLQ